MPLLSRLSVLGAKIESTVGTAETLADADGAFNVFNAKIEPEIEMQDREGQGGFDYLASVPAGAKGRMAFSTYAQWDGTATEPAWADTFFPACGYVKTGQIYTPRSEAPGSNVKTITLGRYVNGTLYQLKGCMGNFVGNYSAGKLISVDWNFYGVWVGRTDAAMLAPTYPTVTNLKWTGGTTTYNSVALFASSAKIESNNTLYMREQGGVTATGYHSCLVTNRRPMVTIDPEATTVAAQDRWGKWLDQSEHAIALYAAGPTTSLMKIDVPKAQIMSISEGDREKVVTDEIKFACNKNGSTADECLSITFTAAV